MLNIPLPILIITWLIFLGCLAFTISGRLLKANFQKRMQQTLAPSEEDIDEIMEEDRDEEMGKSLANRLLAPVLKNLGGVMKAQAGGAKGDMIKEMLEQAGHPLGMYYAEFLGLKMFCLVFFIGVGILSSFFAAPMIISFGELAKDATTVLMVQGIYVIVFAYIGFSGPTFWLRKFVNKRLKQIRKSMADVVDLIVLAIEAGLGFDQAVGEAVSKTTGPLTDELRRVLDEVRVGRPQSEAFRALAQRVKMQELSLLVAAIDQAVKMGTGLAHALRLQANEIRERRMAFIKEQAGKLPVKMMLPLVIFIFPALFVVILGPAAVQMDTMQKSGQLGGMG